MKDGGAALRLPRGRARAGELELVVIDSGSRDGSQATARELADELIEIEPAEFGHGRTRNLGAARASGELICFLTQDAIPVAGWLDAHREAFALDPRVGASFGPHLPHADTSPMIARELTEFFAGFAPNGVRRCTARAIGLPCPTSTRATRVPAGRSFASRSSTTPRTRPSAARCSRRAG